jgi:predicted NUDIX family NTP pyrophosphohydrolase
MAAFTFSRLAPRRGPCFASGTVGPEPFALTRRTEISAGILAFRRGRRLEVLLAHPGGPYWRKRDDGAWSIPKGVVESNDVLACARREFNEETGLTAAGAFLPLTPLRQKSGKLVHAFALEADFDLSNFSSNSFEMEWPPRSGRMQSFPEIDRIAWFGIATARKKILPGQLAFIDELLDKIERKAAE